jgi:hypothetical protein
MGIKVGILVVGLLISSPAFSQSYNGFNTLPEYNFASSDMNWAYGPDRQDRNGAVVLARLRALCSSDSHYDQYYCARGMKVLNKAYSEYKIRKAASAVIAE